MDHENDNISLLNRITNEFKKSPVNSISVVFGLLIAFFSLIFSIYKFLIFSANTNLNPITIDSISNQSLDPGNIFLIIAFFLSTVFPLAILLRVIGKKHGLLAFFISIPLISLINFTTVFMIFLTPPREISPELFLNAHDLILYSSVIIFISICGQSVASDLLSNENNKDNKTLEKNMGAGLFFLIIVLFVWTQLIFKGQVLLTNTFLPEITHIINSKS